MKNSPITRPLGARTSRQPENIVPLLKRTALLCRNAGLLHGLLLRQRKHRREEHRSVRSTRRKRTPGTSPEEFNCRERFALHGQSSTPVIAI